MNNASSPESVNDMRIAMAHLEQRVTNLALAIDRQNVQIGELISMVSGLRNSTDWSAAQVGELLRVLFTSIQQIRDTQVSSLLAEGPITLAGLQQVQVASIEKAAHTLIAARRGA